MPVRIETRQPSKILLIVSLVLVVLAVIGHFVRIPYATQYQFWLAVIGYVVLLAAVLF